MNRKEFIQRFGRISILVGMAALVVLFVGRRQVSGSAECGLKGGCKNCGKLGSCSLPEAKRSREQRAEEKGEGRREKGVEGREWRVVAGE